MKNNEIYIDGDDEIPRRYLTVKKINDREDIYFTDKIEGIQSWQFIKKRKNS